MAVSGSNSTQIHPSDQSPSTSSETSLSNLKIYAAVGVIAACMIAASGLIFLCVRRSRESRKHKMRVKHSSGLIPLVSKEIGEIKESDRTVDCEKGEVIRVENKKEIEFENGVSKKSQESDVSGGGRSDVSVEDPNLGWGRWYSLKELEMATDGFVEENVIGEGGYGIVYRGVSPDGSVVAVKNLLNNK